MKLSVIDRIVITQSSLLPETASIEIIKLVISIRSKIDFTSEQLTQFNIVKPYANIIQVNAITEEMLVRDTEYDFTEAELNLLVLSANNVNNNGWVTISSLETIEMLINSKQK